jgi:hypothetical protein
MQTLSTIELDGWVGKSKTVYTPLDSLIELATLPPPWSDQDGTPISELFERTEPVFALRSGELRQHQAIMVDHLEDIDKMLHGPADASAEVLVEKVHYFGAHGADFSSSAPLRSLKEELLGATSLSGAGWRYIDGFMETNRTTIDQIWKSVPRDGLRYCDFKWYEPFEALGPDFDFFVWTLCHQRYGWNNQYSDGMRFWGTKNLKVPFDFPKEMTDIRLVD